MPGLVALLRDESEDVRGSAAEALGRLGAVEGTAADAIVTALDDPEDRVAGAAAEAIRSSVRQNVVFVPLPPEGMDRLMRLKGTARTVPGLYGTTIHIRDVAWDLLYGVHQQGAAGTRGASASGDR